MKYFCINYKVLNNTKEKPNCTYMTGNDQHVFFIIQKITAF